MLSERIYGGLVESFSIFFTLGLGFNFMEKEGCFLKGNRFESLNLHIFNMCTFGILRMDSALKK